MRLLCAVMTSRAFGVRALGAVGVVGALLLVALVVVSASGASVSHRPDRHVLVRCDRLVEGDTHATARAVPGSADPQVSQELSIFRAPRTHADVLPAPAVVGRALAQASARTYDPAASVRLHLPAAGGGSVYAVPVTLATPSLPARCLHLRALAGLRAAFGLHNQETGSGPGVCLVTTQVATSGPRLPFLPGKRRPKPKKETLADAGCESLTVMASYLGVFGGGLSRSGAQVALVPDGVTSVTYALADGRQVTASVSDNLLTEPAALRRPIRAARPSRAQLRRILTAREPATVTEHGAGGAVLATYDRPPGLIDEIVRLASLLRRSLVSGSNGSKSVVASCSARTHRCVAVVVTTSCSTRHHRCTTTRTIDRYRYVGARPPRGTTGRVVVPTAPIRARLNRYVVHPRRLSLALSGTAHHRVDVLESVSCFSGRQLTSVSGETGPPLQVAVPSRTRLALPGRHRACDVNVLVVSAQRGPVHARLIRG